MIKETKDYVAHLLMGIPIEFAKGVFIKIPTVEEVAFETNYGLYVSCFTKLTREIFAFEREIDELEAQYPTLWSVMIDKHADVVIGRYFSETKTLTRVVYEGLAYWTGLDADVFSKLTNGKIYYKTDDVEWLIDETEFNRFADFIKFLTLWKKPERIAPKINSDNRHQVWIRNYTGYLKAQSKKGNSFLDKILVLSVSSGSFIPLDEIKKMTLFHFNQLQKVIGMKSIYKEKELLRASPKYDIKKEDMKHWMEEFKIN